MEAGLLWFCNWSTLGVCAALKLPQIYAQLATRSARGISLPSLLLELVPCLSSLPMLLRKPAAHLPGIPHSHCTRHCPPALRLSFQWECEASLALHGCICVFLVHPQPAEMDHRLGHACKCHCILAITAVLILATAIILFLIKNLCTVISAASKFAQLQYLWKAQDSGAVSALTWGLSAYTCATRVITTLMTTNDLTILIRFVIMLALNIWVTATVLHYRKPVTKAE